MYLWKVKKTFWIGLTHLENMKVVIMIYAVKNVSLKICKMDINKNCFFKKENKQELMF